jgi:hypothetical protein
LALGVTAGFEGGAPPGRDTTFGMREKMLQAKEDEKNKDSFWGKVKAAFKIFFPATEEETARLEAKKRLRRGARGRKPVVHGSKIWGLKSGALERRVLGSGEKPESVRPGGLGFRV